VSKSVDNGPAMPGLILIFKIKNWRYHEMEKMLSTSEVAQILSVSKQTE